MKIKSKRNGLLVDALHYTDVAVKLGNGKFAEYVPDNGEAKKISSMLKEKDNFEKAEENSEQSLQNVNTKKPLQENTKRKKVEKKEYSAQNETVVEEL